MKKHLILLCILIGGATTLFAYGGINQHLSPEEFKTKQKAFITEKAGLTDKEAKKFFPVYFELQDKKKELNDQIWKLMRKGKDDNLKDEHYEAIMLQIHNLRLETVNLDKSYYDKFKKVLSPKKIFQVQKAESRFHREMLKKAQDKRK